MTAAQCGQKQIPSRRLSTTYVPNTGTSKRSSIATLHDTPTFTTINNMPNWCSTSYRIQGDSKELKQFNKLIQALEKRKHPLVKSDFGNLWLGCIVEKLHGNSEETYCRGYIIDYKLEDDTLSLHVESAWAEPYEWRAFIKKQYPSFQIYYMSEEGGCGYYVTNDKDGKFFPDKYLLDSDELEQQYFTTLEEACIKIGELCDKKVDTVSDIEEALSEYSESHNDMYLQFIEYAVIDD